jgi:hypothetical protein
MLIKPELKTTIILISFVIVTFISCGYCVVEKLLTSDIESLAILMVCYILIGVSIGGSAYLCLQIKIMIKLHNKVKQRDARLIKKINESYALYA